jgi:hypothetical protein
MKPEPLPNHNDDSFRTFALILRALITIADQHERGRRYRNALVARHPRRAQSFASLNYPL